MSALISLAVPGRPRTKGSLHGICTRNRSHTIHYSEQVADSAAWRKRVARRLREAQLTEHGTLLVHTGPVEVRLVFFFARSAGPAGETLWPTSIVMGDLDKLTRNVLDALSAPTKREQFEGCSALIKDDSQVVSLTAGKFWVHGDHEPGVQILVLPLEDEDPAEVVKAELMQWGILRGAE